MELKFRKCRPQDLKALTEIGRITFSEAFSLDNSEFDFNGYIERAFSEKQIGLELYNPNSEFYFAFLGQTLVGYFKLNWGLAQTDLLDRNGMELERIYVLANHQDRGLGGRLLAKAIDIGRSRSFPFIWLGVWEKNRRAISFYQGHGFVHSGYHPFKLGNEDQTDFIMKLEIEPGVRNRW